MMDPYSTLDGHHLQFFLLIHAELLLLINHKQPQVWELHLPTQKRVCAYNLFLSQSPTTPRRRYTRKANEKVKIRRGKRFGTSYRHNHFRGVHNKRPSVGEGGLDCRKPKCDGMSDGWVSYRYGNEVFREGRDDSRRRRYNFEWPL